MTLFLERYKQRKPCTQRYFGHHLGAVPQDSQIRKSSILSKLPGLIPKPFTESKEVGNSEFPMPKNIMKSETTALNVIDMIQFCKRRYDVKNSNARAAKTLYLGLIQTAITDLSTINTPMKILLTNLFEMISLNLFRPIVRLSDFILYGDSKVNYTTPNWEQMRLVYFILATILKGAPQSEVAEYITEEFIHKLIALLDIPDSQEQASIELNISIIFQNIASHRGLIAQKMLSILIEYQESVRSYTAVGPALHFFLNLMKSLKDISQQYITLYKQYVLTLLTCHYSTEFFPHISALASFLSSKDSAIAGKTLHYVMKRWPLTDSSKEVSYLSLIGAISQYMSTQHVKQLVTPLFKVISQCVVSPNFKVASSALKICTDPGFVLIFSAIPEKVLPIITIPLKQCQAFHWHADVKLLAIEASRLMYTLNGTMMSSILMKQNGDEEELENQKNIETCSKWAEIAKETAHENKEIDLILFRSKLESFLNEVQA